MVAPKAFVIFTQENASMDESLMFTYFEKVWQTYVKEKQKELGFDRSFMVYDASKAHKTDNVKVLLATNNTNSANLVPRVIFALFRLPLITKRCPGDKVVILH